MDGAPVVRSGLDGVRDALAIPACDVCGGPTFERHCKIICTRCGYVRDCSDP